MLILFATNPTGKIFKVIFPIIKTILFVAWILIFYLSYFFNLQPGSPVNVVFNIFRHIIVDHMLDLREVQTLARHVRGNCKKIEFKLGLDIKKKKNDSLYKSG